MYVLTMLKKSENNDTEEIGLVTPTPGLLFVNTKSLFMLCPSRCINYHVILDPIITAPYRMYMQS